MLKVIVGFEETLLIAVTKLYDASYNASVAYTVTSNGLLIIAHILYVVPEISNKSNDADIIALSCGVSPSSSANAGTVTIMHIKSASVIHRIFLFILTSIEIDIGFPKTLNTANTNESPPHIIYYLRRGFSCDQAFQ